MNGRRVLPAVGGFGVGVVLVVIALIIALLVLIGAINDTEKLEWVAILLLGLGILL